MNGSQWADHLIQPHFVISGNGVDEPIDGLVGINRQSVDVLMETVASDMALGISAVMLFPVIDKPHRDATGTMASTPDNPLIQATRSLREKHGESLVILADVCLCTYTDHGNCGIIVNGHIDNDSTLPHLTRQAIALADAGVDYVALSDMMDHRVAHVRSGLEKEGHTTTGILAYSAKYASSFYGPFQEAAHSAPSKWGRSSHQMDFRSTVREALLEVDMDIEEGADIVMIKPALPYLDIISAVADRSLRPVAAYHVSGEYAMLNSAAKDDDHLGRMVNETLHSIRRSGAELIVTYHARRALEQGWLT